MPLQPLSPPTHQRTHAQPPDELPALPALPAPPALRPDDPAAIWAATSPHRALWEPALASLPVPLRVATAAPATAPSTPPSARPPAPAASGAAALPRAHDEPGRATALPRAHDETGRATALPRAHDETGRAAGPEGLLWGDLTWDERRAAAWLGYDETSWDRGEAPPTCMHPWATLTADEQRAASILGYTAATWNAELDQGDGAPEGALRVTDEADADGANDETFGAGAVDATPATTLPTPLGMALPALSSAAVSIMSHSHSHSHSQLPPFASHSPPAFAPMAPVAAHLARAAAAAAPSRTAEIQIPSRTAEIPSRSAVIPSILIDCSSVAAADNPLEMGFLNLNAVRDCMLIAC